MITAEQEKRILERAYVPEHLVGLMTRVSGGEPFLIEDYFCVRAGGTVIVVGYPVEGKFEVDSFQRALQIIRQELGPASLAIAAPQLPAAVSDSCLERESDRYYTLDPARKPLPSRLKRIVDRAMADLVVERGLSLGDEHLRLAREFVQRVNPPPRITELLFRMWDFVGGSADAVVLNAWSRSRKLTAFFVVDFSAEDFSTYVIGCHSKRNYVQGASDALCHEMIVMSTERGKSYIHLGLGVNPGIRRFKEKWGGVPTLPYEMCRIVVRKPSMIGSVVRYLLTMKGSRR